MRRVKGAREDSDIAEFPRQPTAESCLEELRAETRLAKIDLFEDLAELYDTEHSPTLRSYFVERYRKLVGVHPEQRTELREALERVKSGRGMPVADVIDLFNRDHAKRSLAAIAEAADA